MDMLRIEELARVVDTFNYDYHQFDNHNAWSGWHNIRTQHLNIFRKMTSEELLAVYNAVERQHNERVAPYLGRGVSKLFAEDQLKRQNVIGFLGSIDV
jgi:hypothetical protein